MPRRLQTCGEDSNFGKWADENYDVKKELVASNDGEMPWTPAFTTSAFEESEYWSEESPPDVLFYFQPPPVEEATFCEPQAVVDEGGNIVMSPHEPDRELRTIPILPDRISVDVPGWMMMAWRRLDPRILLQDFIDRMTTDLGEAQELTELSVRLPTKNSLQNRCNRNCRKVLCYFTEFAAHQGEAPRAGVEAITKLTTNNITYNTTLSIHPTFNRLVKVKFFRQNGQMLHATPLHVTADNLEETTYPLDWFLYKGYEPQVTGLMNKSVSTLLMLQERAIKHGLNIDDWKRLDRSCLPASWFDRTKTQTPSNETFNGGCIYCTWVSGDDDDWEHYQLGTGGFEPSHPMILEDGVDGGHLEENAVDSSCIDNEDVGIGFDELFEANDLPSSPLAAVPRNGRVAEIEMELGVGEAEQEEEKDVEQDRRGYPALPEIEWEQDEFDRPESSPSGPMLPSLSLDDDEEELSAFTRPFVPAVFG